MTYLHPIQPLLHTPLPRERVCLDHATDEQRRTELLLGSGEGLGRLLVHPKAPVTIAQGIHEGTWGEPQEEGVYLHREEYSLPGGVEKSRWGVLVGLDPANCPLHPVVEADPDEVDRLFEELQTAGVDPGGIAAVYRDENHYLEQLVEARTSANPLLTISDSFGGRHSVWRLSDEEGEAVLALLERCGSAIVGDLALYQALVRVSQSPSALRFRPVVHFYHQRDFGVSFTGTARLHADFEDFDINHLLAALHERYEVKECRLPETVSAETCRDFFEQIRTDGITRRTLGVMVAGSSLAFQVVVHDDDVPSFGRRDVPEVAREFDSEWAQRGIAEVYFPREIHTPIRVLSDISHTPEALTTGNARVAFIINPPPKRFLPKLSEAAWRLPIGSLQFKPPVPRGLAVGALPSLKLS